MAITVSYSKSDKPACVSVWTKNDGSSEAQTLVDAIRDNSVNATYNNDDKTLLAHITPDKLDLALKQAAVNTAPVREELVAAGRELASTGGRKF